MKPKNIFIQGAVSSAKIAKVIQHHNSKTNIGGHSIFLGQVRADEKPEGNVQAIEYTAYEEMALEKAYLIREEIFEKYPLTCMHIYHSLGKINAGEICLFVFTSSKHRAMAMDACRYVVEEIKANVPVFGKEIFEDGEHQWKENK